MVRMMVTILAYSDKESKHDLSNPIIFAFQCNHLHSNKLNIAEILI